MSKILDVNQLLMLAQYRNTRADKSLIIAVEAATSALAVSVADMFDVEIDVSGVTYQGEAFGGLCASFYPKHQNQSCPPELQQADPEGDWE